MFDLYRFKRVLRTKDGPNTTRINEIWEFAKKIGVCIDEPNPEPGAGMRRCSEDVLIARIYDAIRTRAIVRAQWVSVVGTIIALLSAIAAWVAVCSR
jgi:hypothetical protein